MTEDTAHTAQTIADDALIVARALGIVCPPLVIPAAAVKLIVDAGFALLLREAAKALDAQRAAQTAGVAAAEAQAATTALERMKRAGCACRPCLEAFAVLLDEEKARP